MYSASRLKWYISISVSMRVIAGLIDHASLIDCLMNSVVVVEVGKVKEV